MASKVWRFDEGGVWEFSSWELQFDVEYDDYDAKPCKHAKNVTWEEETLTSGEIHRCNWEWTVPRVIVARNEGGYNSTGVCLDCVLETIAKLDKDGLEESGVWPWKIRVNRDGSAEVEESGAFWFWGADDRWDWVWGCGDIMSVYVLAPDEKSALEQAHARRENMIRSGKW